MEDLLSLAVDEARKQGASFAEARFQDATIIHLEFLNGKVRNSSFNSYKGIGIRVLVDNSFGFSSTNALNKESIIECVSKAIKIAKANKRKSNIELEKTRAYKDTIIVKPKTTLFDADLDELIKEVKELDKRIQEVEPRVMIRVFYFTAVNEEKLYMNSDGSRIEHKIPKINLTRFFTVIDPQKGVLQRSRSEGGSSGLEYLKELKIEERAIEDAKILGQILDKGEKLKESGYYDVVIDGEITGLISHESCGHPFEADRILGREAAQGGESYVKLEMLKREKIGSDVLTIVDNPLIEKSLGFYVYDEEGVPARKKYLIKNGVVEELLLNREYAAKLSTTSNGSARATAYFNEPLIRMSNTYIEPGDYSVEELIEDVKKGVYFKSYMEWNIDDRRWNQKYGGLEAYLIENGEIKGFLRNPVLEVTTGQLYKSIDAVGKDLKFEAGLCGKGEPMQGVPVWFGGPTIRARRLWIK